jgi:hypothetical protein
MLGVVAIYSVFWGAARYFHLRGWRWAEISTVIAFCLVVLVWNILAKQNAKAALKRKDSGSPFTDSNAP